MRHSRGLLSFPLSRRERGTGGEDYEEGTEGEDYYEEADRSENLARETGCADTERRPRLEVRVKEGRSHP